MTIFYCSEPTVRRTMRWLPAADIEGIEKKTFTVMGKDVTFSFDLLPGDMKFLAYINGELSNSAKYFSSFANACQDESSSLTEKFGKTQNCKWSVVSIVPIIFIAG